MPNLDLSVLTDTERIRAGKLATSGILCTIARVRSERNLRTLANDMGVSHVTILAWVRRSDARLTSFWKRCGYTFPTDSMTMAAIKIGKCRELIVGVPIVDHGVTAEWSGARMKRVANDPNECEYTVDEEQGVYRFSRKLHGRRSVLVSYVCR